MRIQALDGSFLTFTFQAADLEIYPALTFDIEGESQGFRGWVNRVWFPIHDLEQFLVELTSLEKQRQGEAQLHTLSDELQLRIYSTDRLGHMALAAEIQKIAYMGTFMTTLRVAFAFEIEPDCLPGILADFRELFTPK